MYGPASSGRVRNASTCASRSLAISETCDFDSPVIPSDCDQLVHPPGRHPEQVAGRHHRRQGRLGPAAPFQQPVREVRARAQLRDRDVDRADPGVQVAVPVAVAGVRPLRAGLPVPGAAHRVGVGGHQRLDERGQHLTHQIRAGLGQLLVQEPDRVDTWDSGHRGVLFESVVRDHSKDHAVTALHLCSDTITGLPVHHSGGHNCKPDRGELPRARRWASAVVLGLDPDLDRQAQFLAVCQALGVQDVLLQHGDEALHGGVVPRRADALRHNLANPNSSKLPAITTRMTRSWLPGSWSRPRSGKAVRWAADRCRRAV